MRILSILFTFILISCKSNSVKPASVGKDSAMQIEILDTTSVIHSQDTIINSATPSYVWFVDVDNKTKKRDPNFKEEYLNVDSIIKALNSTNPNIKLDKIKISGDTLYTEIRDSEYLGERIGSYGANAYIADVVINLTSIRNINYVKIDCEDGSHFSPGVWSRSDFKIYKELR